MIDGEMQAFSLTLDKFLEHAAKWRSDREVATARGDGRIERIGYAALMDRSRRVSAVLAGLGVKTGDRVATLAWNSQDHVEVWYAIMGMGAVCHTLNPRLTAEQLADMVSQSQARVLIASADLAPLAARVQAAAPGIAKLLVIDGEAAEGEPLAPLVETADGTSVVWATSTRPPHAAFASPPAPPARPRG